MLGLDGLLSDASHVCSVPVLAQCTAAYFNPARVCRVPSQTAASSRPCASHDLRKLCRGPVRSRLPSPNLVISSSSHHITTNKVLPPTYSGNHNIHPSLSSLDCLSLYCTSLHHCRCHRCHLSTVPLQPSPITVQTALRPSLSRRPPPYLTPTALAPHGKLQLHLVSRRCSAFIPASHQSTPATRPLPQAKRHRVSHKPAQH